VGGRLIVISGPSGVGKGTVVSELLNRDKELVLSISVTTRSRRPGKLMVRITILWTTPRSRRCA